MRVQLNAMTINSDSCEQLFTPVEGSLHFTALMDELGMPAKAIADQTSVAVAEAQELVETVISAWRADFKMLIEVIGSWCPPWQHLKESPDLMSEKIIGQMVGNKNCKSLTGAANSLDNMIRESRALASDGFGPMLSPEDNNAATTTRDLAYDTVSVTFAMY